MHVRGGVETGWWVQQWVGWKWDEVDGFIGSSNAIMVGVL